MEKIKLSNGTELEILNGATIGAVSMPYTELSDVVALTEQMTEENLSEYSILNESGLTCTIQKNKYVSEIRINPTDKAVTFVLADVDMVAKRLEALEQTQEIQDSAIVELAEMAAGEVEETEDVVEETTDAVIEEEGE